MPFTQQPPVLENQYLDDRMLRSLLATRLERGLATRISASLGVSLRTGRKYLERRMQPRSLDERRRGRPAALGCALVSLLVIVVLFAFLGNLRAALVTALGCGRTPAIVTFSSTTRPASLVWPPSTRMAKLPE